MNEITNEYAQCAHEGQLINLCANCIRRAFKSEFDSRAFALTDIDCAIIAISIDAFCARFPNQFYATRMNEQIDIANIMRNQFGISRFEMIIEFCEILIFG